MSFRKTNHAISIVLSIARQMSSLQIIQNIFDIFLNNSKLINVIQKD